MTTYRDRHLAVAASIGLLAGMALTAGLANVPDPAPPAHHCHEDEAQWVHAGGLMCTPVDHLTGDPERWEDSRVGHGPGTYTIHQHD